MPTDPPRRDRSSRLIGMQHGLRRDRSERMLQYVRDENRQRLTEYVESQQKTPEEYRAELGQQLRETPVQAARGLAESGYATVQGLAQLGQYLQGVPGSAGATGAAAAAALPAITQSREQMREFYGDPETGPGKAALAAGEMLGTGAQFMVPGAVAMRTGAISAGAPWVTKVAANVALGAPLDVIQGASERERSVAGLLADQANLQALDEIADSPLKRALFEGIAGGALSIVGDLPTVLRGFKHPARARFVEVSPEEFNTALQNFARLKPDYEGFITWRTPEEMRKEGMKMYMTPDGRAGYAIAPDGDMRNLFTTPGSPSGTGAYAVAQAITRGGTKGDAFDTALMDIYRDMGAVENWRMNWDDQYRPNNWNEARWGRPDVVGFEIPENLRGLSQNELFDLYNERRILRGKPGYGAPPASFMDQVRAIWGDERGSVPVAAALEDMRRLMNNLQPDEVAWANSRANNLQNVARVYSELPSAKEWGAMALEGQAKRGWYRKSSRALTDAFGPDAPRFAALLASLSPQNDVATNLEYALRVWNGWERAGRPRDMDAIAQIMRSNISEDVEGMRAWVNNAQRSLIEEDPVAYTLSGPKVNSFMRNLLEDVDAVTLDTWMARLGGVEQGLLAGRQIAPDAYGLTKRGKNAQYVGFSARIRETADYLTKLTGSQWTPEQVQETVWSWGKALEEKGKWNIRAVTDEMVADVPDFGTLMEQPRYQGLLELGHGPISGEGPSFTRTAGAGPEHEARLLGAAERLRSSYGR